MNVLVDVTCVTTLRLRVAARPGQEKGVKADHTQDSRTETGHSEAQLGIVGGQRAAGRNGGSSSYDKDGKEEYEQQRRLRKNYACVGLGWAGLIGLEWILQRLGCWAAGLLGK